MKTIVIESRLQSALQSRLPPATKYLILLSNMVRVYREQETIWDLHQGICKDDINNECNKSKAIQWFIGTTNGTNVNRYTS